MPVRSFMARVLWGERDRAHAAARYGLRRRQENAAQLACRPSPAPIETAVRNAPTREDAE